MEVQVITLQVIIRGTVNDFENMPQWNVPTVHRLSFALLSTVGEGKNNFIIKPGVKVVVVFKEYCIVAYFDNSQWQ